MTTRSLHRSRSLSLAKIKSQWKVKLPPKGKPVIGFNLTLVYNWCTDLPKMINKFGALSLLRVQYNLLCSFQGSPV